MSRPTNNYKTTNLDFIKTLANIAEPFNSSFLDSYEEYESNIAAYKNDERECFLSILNKVGEDGCQVLTDKVVNYIDDISNIDTTIPSALLSQAQSTGYPYKDKKTIEQLARLSTCSPLLQSLVWAVSTNARNSKTILNRLNIVDEVKIETELSSNTTDILNSKISSDISSLIYDNIFNKQFLYLDGNEVSINESPYLMDFSWILNSIFSNEIIQNSNILSYFDSCCIDFGKYNKTIYSIICHSYLYAQLHDKNIPSKIDELNDLSKKCMPFLYDNRAFDPLQAAWSIVYDTSTLSDYDKRYHEIITNFIYAFNKQLDKITYKTVMDFIEKEHSDNLSININFVSRLNANAFTYQQQLVKFIEDVRTLFAIDIKNYFLNEYKDYLEKTVLNKDYWIDIGSLNFSGFAPLQDSLFKSIDWESYISAIIENIYSFGKKIRILREDVRLMTLRNSYKGTSALIQFAVIEYLRDCIDELIENAYTQYVNENTGKPIVAPLVKENINAILNKLKESTQQEIGISEYWDYTEYFNRIDESGSEYNVDWDKDDINWKAYGSTTEEDIFNFYTNILKIPKEIYNNSEDATLTKNQLLRNFLRAVYNSGVFTKRTNDNYEAIYSGNLNETTNTSPWVAIKNIDNISKEIHPYIWNFTNKLTNRLYTANSVTIAVQNAEYELLNSHIGEGGNILDQYRLTKNFVDSTGYVTRYENRDHLKNEITKSYDGFIYPGFAYDIATHYNDKESILQNWSIEPISSSIKQKWYNDQDIVLSNYEEKCEISNLINLIESDCFRKSVSLNDSSESISNVLQNYCIDRFETAYGVKSDLGNQIVYKENGYPFMRPLVKFSEISGQPVNMGMLFINADDSIDTEISSRINNDIDDKFPRVVISEDGTHLLLRINENEIRSYEVTTHKNKNNEFEKALKLNACISCNETLFDENYFNDSLIKTVDDAFYILIPRYDTSISAFVNYLVYLKNKQPNVLISKQIFANTNQDDLFGTGLFLNKGESVFTNFYYVNKQQEISTVCSTNPISAIYSEKADSTTFKQSTKIENATKTDSSYSAFNQFLQLYSSKTYNPQNQSFKSIFIDKTNSTAKPSIDLSFSRIDEELNGSTSIVSIQLNNQTGFFDSSLMNSTVRPFARAFNINSDAGFNSVYIGETGKHIINNIKNNDEYTAQMELAKTTGAAFELLGPQATDSFDLNVSESNENNGNDNNYDDGLNEDGYNFQRIHEFYSEDVSSYLAKSYEISSDGIRKNAYHYGYTSIIENPDYKNDKYIINQVFIRKLDKINKSSNYVTWNVNTDNPKIFIDFVNQDYAGIDWNLYRFYLFIGVNNKLYSLIPRKTSTMIVPETLNGNTTESKRIYSALKENSTSNDKYTIQFNNTFVIDKILFKENCIYVYAANSALELLNADLMLVLVSAKNEDSPFTPMPSPNFMLPVSELVKNIENNESNCIDNHMMIPYTSSTKSYMNVDSTDKLKNNNLSISEISSGSLVFTLNEIDSDKMQMQFSDKDQYEKSIDVKSITVEAINDYLRTNELKTKTFDTLDYEFKPWKIVDLSLERNHIYDNVDFGFEENADMNSESYLIQPYKQNVTLSQDSYNKYTVTFWRASEQKTPITQQNINAENTLPTLLKVSEISSINGTNTYRPIYGSEHESISKYLNGTEFTPKLAVQWQYESDKNSRIKLKFCNSLSSDSSIINSESGLIYKSLSKFKSDLVLNPGESNYIDIVAPQHVVIGNTVFYNIPLMRAFVTNISDDKPKFMLTLLNDKTNKQMTLESNNYALVFMSSSMPQTTNSDTVYVTGYVAPMTSINQTKPPSVANSVTLSELSFNFDIANIINKYDLFGSTVENKSLIDENNINVITNENKISDTANAYVNYENNMYQIRISEPYGRINGDGTEFEPSGFNSVNMKINLRNMSEYNLKNALLTAHGNVIAYNKDGYEYPIVKIFGCSLDRIGEKHVISVHSEEDNNETNDSILSVTQNSGRETALLVNKKFIDLNKDQKYFITFANYNDKILSRKSYQYGTPAAEIRIPPNPTKPRDEEHSYDFAGWDPPLEDVTRSIKYIAQFEPVIKYEISWLMDDDSLIDTTYIEYGQLPEFEVPTKTKDAQYTYQFDKWVPDLAIVEGPATYKASFTPTTRSYTVRFNNYDGKKLSSKSYKYGTLAEEIVIPKTPKKPNDDEYTYVFAGWNKPLQTVVTSATYTATYTEVPIAQAIEISCVMDDDTLITTMMIAEGEIAVLDDPTKPATDDYEYDFAGWIPDPAETPIHAPTVFKASFTQLIKTPSLSSSLKSVDSEYVTNAQSPDSFTLNISGPWKAKIVDVKNLMTSTQVKNEWAEFKNSNFTVLSDRELVRDTADGASASYNALNWIRLDNGTESGATEITGTDTSTIRFKILSKNMRGFRSGKIVISRPNDTDPHQFTPLEFVIKQTADLNIYINKNPHLLGQRGFRQISYQEHAGYVVEIYGHSPWKAYSTNSDTGQPWIVITQGGGYWHDEGDANLVWKIYENWTTYAIENQYIIVENSSGYKAYLRLYQSHK